MIAFWTTVLDIVIFIVSLGILIIIHELGHLTTAKIFKVYCYEFSIGMGSAIYTHKPNKEKGQETAFSIRVLPIGGYVSMAGEDLEDAEGVDKSIVIPRNRTMEGIARWKRVIIMVAGVLMNFMLAYILLFVNYSAVPQTTYFYSSNAVTIVEDSAASEAGLQTGDEITSINQDFYYRDANGLYQGVPDDSTGAMAVTSYAFTSTPDNLLDYNTSINSLLQGNVYLDSEDSTKVVTYTAKKDNDKRVITFEYERDGEAKTATITSLAVADDDSDLSWGKIGMGASYEIFNYTAGEAFGLAWNQFTWACSAIFVGLGTLFTPAGFSSAGGIVAIFQISSMAVASGVASVINLWALISVNLAILNLLPFPGLDGWQIVVTIVEGIAETIRKSKNKNRYTNLSESDKKELLATDELRAVKRKIKYNKVKNIVSYVGLGLLVLLSVVLIFKDIFFPVV